MWVLFEQKKRELWNKWHLMENKAKIMQHALKLQHIFFSLNI
jgi:hypothetical protein